MANLEREFPTKRATVDFRLSPEQWVRGSLEKQVDQTALELPGTALALVQDPIHRWDNEDVQKHERKIFGRASLLPPDSPLLSPTYQALMLVIVDPDQPTVNRFSAALLGNALLQQSSRPLPEKYFSKGAGKIISPRELQATANRESDLYPPTEDSQKIIGLFQKEVEEFFAERQTFPEEVDIRDEIQVANDIIRFAGSPFGKFLQMAGNPELHDQGAEMNTSRLKYVLTSPQAESLLLSGEIDTVPTELRMIIWKMHLASHMLWEDEDTVAKEAALRSYFFIHPDLQSLFWATKPDQEVPLGERFPYEHHFFMQDKQTRSAFLETRPQGEDSKYYLKQLVGAAAEFKTNYPKHANVGAIAAEILECAESEGLADVIRRPYEILTDQEPGIIYMTAQGEVRSKADKQKVPPRATLLYLSEPKKNPDVKPALTEEEDIQQEMPLPKGEAQFFRIWKEVHVPDEEHVPAVLEQLGNRFEQTDPDPDQLLDVALDVADTTAPKHTIVVPSLLEETHPLYALHEAGIVAVERHEREVSVIIDAPTAAYAAAQKIVVSGEITPQGITFVGAPESFVATPLDLALQGAVTLSEKDITGEPKGKAQQRVDRARERVVAWNAQMKPHYPAVDYHAPHEDDIAIVVPVTRKDIIHMTLANGKKES